MIVFNRKVKPILLIGAIVLVLLIIYLAVNYKEIKQNFINGFNDGRAQKAKENK